MKPDALHQSIAVILWQNILGQPSAIFFKVALCNARINEV